MHRHATPTTRIAENPSSLARPAPPAARSEYCRLHKLHRLSWTRHSHSRLPQRQVVTRQSTGAAVIEDASAAAPQKPFDPTAAVDRVLQLIEGTDSGDRATPEQREEIDSLLNQLEAFGETQEPRPLDNPLVYGNYNVAYVSTGNRQLGQPAGGRFRTGIGKVLFGTTMLAQSVLAPDIVTNKVQFALLGVLPGAVGLRGKLVSIPEVEGGPNNKDTVKVFFDPAVISLPGGVHTRLGGTSSVVLKTTYLDERVRLGRGSRGSLFVFTRGGQADRAGMDQVGLERTSPLGLLLLTAVLSGLVGAGALAASRPSIPTAARALGALAALLGAGLTVCFWRGGQLEDNTDREEVQLPAEGAADGSKG